MLGFFRSLFGSANHKDKGISFLEEKKYDDAITELTEALKKSPDDEIVLLNIGQAFLEIKKYDDAITNLQKAAQKASSVNPVPAIMLGYAYYKADRLDEAEKSIEAALKIDSKHPAAYYYRGLISLKHGRVDEATDAFEEVISERPTFVQARLLAIGEMFIIKNEKTQI